MKYIITALTLAFALALPSFAKEKEKKSEIPPPSAQSAPSSQEGMPAEGMDMEAMMQQYAALMAPGEEHKELGKCVSKWTLKIRMMMPGMPPHESSGTSEIHWILDGHYLQEDVTGDMMGNPFHGINIIGYDKFRKQYVNCWIDNMSTGIWTSSGFHDPATNSTTMMGQMDDPMTGDIGKWSKSIIRMVDDDHFTMEMHDLVLGANSKVMEIEYSRVK